MAHVGDTDLFQTKKICYRSARINKKFLDTSVLHFVPTFTFYST